MHLSQGIRNFSPNNFIHTSSFIGAFALSNNHCYVLFQIHSDFMDVSLLKGSHISDDASEYLCR